MREEHEAMFSMKVKADALSVLDVRTAAFQSHEMTLYRHALRRCTSSKGPCSLCNIFICICRCRLPRDVRKLKPSLLLTRYEGLVLR